MLKNLIRKAFLDLIPVMVVYIDPLGYITNTTACQREHMTLCTARDARPRRFPRVPLIMRVPFFLLFSLNKGTLKQKGGKREVLGNQATKQNISVATANCNARF